jgi:hypothetical protein
LAEDAGDVNDLNIKVFLTLCYTDCAVDDVPIPGEPCRSEDSLMSPSRIADDYVLNFTLDRPVHREMQALAVLTGWMNGVADGAETDPAAVESATTQAGKQIMAALGLHVEGLTAADLAPVDLAAALHADLQRGLQHWWITRLRPLVMAQGCADAAVPANDCVLLAELAVPVSRTAADAAWEPGAFDTIDLSQRNRPMMMSAMAMQSGFGRIQLSQLPPESMAFLTGDGEFSISEGILVVSNEAEATIAFGSGATAAEGDMIILRHLTREILHIKEARFAGSAEEPAQVRRRGVYQMVRGRDGGWIITKITEEEEA